MALFLGAFALLGYLSAHAVAYDIVDVAVDDHHHVHGYFSWLELVSGASLVAGVLGLVVLAFRGSALGSWLHPGSRAVAARRALVGGGIVPAGTFVVAEYVERLAAGVPAPPDGTLLLLGSAVQVVVGVLAWMFARRCIRAVAHLVSWLRERPRTRIPALTPPRPRPLDGPPARGVMARSQAGRAPPRRRMPQS